MCEQVILQVVAHFPVGYDGDLEEEGAQYIRKETLECFYPKRFQVLFGPHARQHQDLWRTDCSS